MRRIAVLATLVACACASATIALAASKPSATTGTASSTTSNSATINGTVNPNGQSTTYAFQYGTTTSYGQQTASASAGSGTSPQAVSAQLSNLTPGTTYHFRLIATNASGTTAGFDNTFKTTGTAPAPVKAPTVQTKPATNTNQHGATLNGTVNPNGSAVKVYFEFGLSSFYGTQTTPQSVAAGNSTRSVKAVLTGLEANQTYHFRLVAQDANGGSTVGHDMTFRTGPPAPVLRNFKISPPAFRVPGGATISYSDSQAVTTTFLVQRIGSGVTKNGKCVAAHGNTSHAKRCTLFVKVGTFKHRDKKGKNSFHWSGSVNGHKLTPGRYRITAQAHGKNGTSPRKRRRFRVNK